MNNKDGGFDTNQPAVCWLILTSRWFSHAHALGGTFKFFSLKNFFNFFQFCFRGREKEANISAAETPSSDERVHILRPYHTDGRKNSIGTIDSATDRPKAKLMKSRVNEQRITRPKRHQQQQQQETKKEPRVRKRPESCGRLSQQASCHVMISTTSSRQQGTLFSLNRTTRRIRQQQHNPPKFQTKNFPLSFPTQFFQIFTDLAPSANHRQGHHRQSFFVNQSPRSV